MAYVDTNVLIYASVEQDLDKKRTSLSLLKQLIDTKELVLSTLVLQEFVFTLAKLKIDSDIIRQDSTFYFNFVSVEYDFISLQKAIDYCCHNDSCKNINDIIHLHLAEKSKSNKLITFDRDFLKFENVNSVAIELIM